MPETNLELARRGFEEYNRSGFMGVIDLMEELDRLDPDYLFHIQDGLPTAGTYHGVEGYKRVTAEWDEAWSSFTIEPKEFIEVDEERILVPVRQEAVAKGSGLEVEADFFYVFIFRDGRYWQMHLYYDRAAADQAIEAAA